MSAYLDLLKLALCDLINPHVTSQAYRNEDGSVTPKLLGQAQRQDRWTGHDWPLTGLTMVGMERLSDLEHCIETLVSQGVSGDLIEAGCWRGGAAIFMRAVVNELKDAYGFRGQRTVWVADSFEGFRAGTATEGDVGFEAFLARYDHLAVSEEYIKANFANLGLDDGVRFHKGYFEESLAELCGHKWSLIRSDADTYSGTWATLEALYPDLSSGGYVVVDDYQILSTVSDAVDTYRAENGITAELVKPDWNCCRWRKP